MDAAHFNRSSLRDERRLAEQAFSRAAGAPLVGGNTVSLLQNAEENYPAWLSAIKSAKHTIFFENYIFASDLVGKLFLEALCEKAKAGVKVYVLYDWMGSFFTKPFFFRPLILAGGTVKCFNPLSIANPLAWLVRDHRKSLIVDNQIGFISGLCISQRWLGFPTKNIPPWRDTGVEIKGPAVDDISKAFIKAWTESGELFPCMAEEKVAEPIGHTFVRIIASEPYASGLYRLDQLIAAMARETLWLTDAYFVGTPAYTQALCAAALDGVDVRLLVPGNSDIPLLSPLSRASYRPLLEAGVRVFEWNGSMIHAKTAVADGKWARVGSSNLNLASWISNYELDVAIEDTHFAEEMEIMYLNDLEHATEITLSQQHAISPKPISSWSKQHQRGLVTAMRLRNTVTQAIQEHKVLGAVEAFALTITSVALIGVALITYLNPIIIAYPIAIFCTWLSISLFTKAWFLFRRPQLQQPKPPPIWARYWRKHH
jgi:cardiolipin synthase